MANNKIPRPPLTRGQNKKVEEIGEDEILVRDEEGNFQFLRSGEASEEERAPSRARPGIETLEEIVVGIKAEAGLAPSEENTARLDEVIISRLKDVRDEAETKAVLLADYDKGGLKLNEKQANSLLQAIEKKLRNPEVAGWLAQMKTLKTPEARNGRREAKKEKAIPVFDFYPEDEEEIKKIKKEATEINKKIISGNEGKIAEIARALALNFSSEEMRARFNQALDSRLKDIRDEMETKEVLMRAKENGGLGLGEEQAKRIIVETRKYLNRPAKPGTTVDVRSVRGPREPLKIAPLPPAIVKASPLPPPLPQVRKPKEDLPAKPQLVDVKFSPKLVGPVEELARLNLVDWRRLSQDPEVRAGKIIDKINLLEEGGFEKKIAGIKAWQESEVYRLYLLMGNESVQLGQPMKEVIGSRRKAGQAYLEEAEFTAILGLNKKLRF